jgi:hypothetical protein
VLGSLGLERLAGQRAAGDWSPAGALGEVLELRNPVGAAGPPQLDDVTIVRGVEDVLTGVSDVLAT